MARFTADMGDISVQHVKPITDKSGYTSSVATAGLIKNVGEMGIEAYKSYEIGQAKEDYETLATEIKEADAQYSMQDVMAIEDFGQRMTAFRDMAAQGKKSDEMKLRAEALLKQQIARTPGLEREFRQAAASIIGIDPAGQGAKTAFARMAEEEADAERILTQVANDSVTNFGMLPGEVYTKEGQEKYMALSEIRSSNNLKEMQLKSLETTAKIGAVKQDTVDKANSKHFSDPSVQIGYAGTSRTSAQQTVNKYLNGAELSAQTISNMSQDDRTALITELKSSQRAAASIYEKYAAGFDTRDQFEDILTRIVAPYQDYIDLIEGKTTIDSLKNWNAFETETIKQEIYKSPELKAYVAVAEILKNSNAPVEIFNKLLSKSMKTFATALPDPDNPNKLPTAPSKEKQQAATADDVRSLVQPLTKILSTDVTTEESRNTSIKIIENIATMLEDGDSYKPEVVDSFIDVLNSPSTAEGMRQALQNAPQAKMSINDLMAKHVQRAGNGAANSLQRVLEGTSYPSDVENVDSPETTAFVYPELQGDQVVVRINERAATEWALNNQLTGSEQQNMMRKMKKKMARINAGPIASLNKIISATSNLYNQPRNEVAVQVLKRSGRLSQQISNLPLPSREQEMGMAMQQEAREVVRDENGQLRFK
jgi:hypothetical protein